MLTQLLDQADLLKYLKATQTLKNCLGSNTGVGLRKANS